MTSPLETVPRSVYARVMFVELEGPDAVARVIEAAARISPDLVHVLVTRPSISPAARAVLAEAAAEVGAEVMTLPPGMDAEEAFAAVRVAVRAVRQRRGGT
jgi:hypothetical protein